MERVLGVVIILVFFGAIVAAIVQIARGRFGVDYDQLAQEAVRNAREAKKRKNQSGK